VNVFYDGKNNVVSMYFNLEEDLQLDNNLKTQQNLDGKNYDNEKAANLILDMVDLVDEGGKIIGLRVFNASRYYDIELLKAADTEELSQEELNKKQDEKLIAIIRP
jgi:uncharacterized protein YuzE